MFFRKNTLDHLEKGKLGEDAACRYLKKNGYKIIERNYRYSFGEIDIIARKGETYVFIEVKTRKLGTHISGSMSVNNRKQQKILKSACCYLTGKKIKPPMRFDIIEVYSDELFKKVEINHIENAFESRSDYAVF